MGGNHVGNHQDKMVDSLHANRGHQRMLASKSLVVGAVQVMQVAGELEQQLEPHDEEKARDRQ
jgi:hypothetical protein